MGRALVPARGRLGGARARGPQRPVSLRAWVIGHVEFDAIEGFLEHRADVVRWRPTPEIRITGDGAGRIVLSPNRTFAAYETASFEAHGARGRDRYRVFELGTGALIADHVHRWKTPTARTARCWFGAGLRTLVIEYADDRDPTYLRF